MSQTVTEHSKTRVTSETAKTLTENEEEIGECAFKSFHGKRIFFHCFVEICSKASR